MGKTLVLAEKPSVGRELARVLDCKIKKEGCIEGAKYIETFEEIEKYFKSNDFKIKEFIQIDKIPLPVFSKETNEEKNLDKKDDSSDESKWIIKERHTSSFSRRFTLPDDIDSENVKATFFVVGNNASKYPEVVRQIAGQGHEVALHAGEHKDFLKLNSSELAGNISSGKKVLEELTGKPVKYMRPPHGFRDWAVMETASDFRLKVVNWSVIPRDWTNPGAQVIADRVCKDVFPGAIVLLHDGDAPSQTASREQTVEATALIIDELRKQGYNFVTVSQLLERK